MNLVLIAVVGNLGVGKTLFIVREGFHYMKKGYHIYTNFEVSYPHVQLKNPKQLISVGLTNPKPKVLLLDEGYLWFDALIKSSKQQQFYRNFINVSRKLNYIIYFTSQTLGQINYRSRLLFDFIIEPEIIKPKDKKMFMKVFIFIPNTLGGFRLGENYTIPNIENYFQFYDTNEIINDFITDFNLNDEPKLINGIQQTLERG